MKDVYERDKLYTFREVISIILPCRPSSINGLFNHWNGVIILLVTFVPFAQGRLQYTENIGNEYTEDQKVTNNV